MGRLSLLLFTSVSCYTLGLTGRVANLAIVWSRRERRTSVYKLRPSLPPLSLRSSSFSPTSSVGSLRVHFFLSLCTTSTCKCLTLPPPGWPSFSRLLLMQLRALLNTRSQMPRYFRNAPACPDCGSTTHLEPTSYDNENGNGGRLYYQCDFCGAFAGFDDRIGVFGSNPLCWCGRHSRLVRTSEPAPYDSQLRHRYRHRYLCAANVCSYRGRWVNERKARRMLAPLTGGRAHNPRRAHGRG